MGVLTELGVKSAKEGTHGDGDGLMLVVRASGKKSWVLRYQMNGARRDMGLGRYPEIGLKEARQRALDARRLIGESARPHRGASGPPQGRKVLFRPSVTSPRSSSRTPKARPTNEKVRYQWARHLGPAYSGPLLDRPVNEITTIADRRCSRADLAHEAGSRSQDLSCDPSRVRSRSRHPPRRARDYDEPEPGRVERLEGARFRGPARTQPRASSVFTVRSDGGIHDGPSWPGGNHREGAGIS